MNCPGYLGSRERMTAGTHCEEVQHFRACDVSLG